MSQILLYGGSGHAKVIIECIESRGGEVVGVFDDDTSKTALFTYPVIGSYASSVFPEAAVVISIGDNAIRQKISSFIQHRFGTAIHASALISSRTKIAEGTVVMHGAVIQADTIIGTHCIINTNSSVDHDCCLGDFVHIAPGATVCGGVTIGSGTLVGANATVLPNVRIGRGCIIAAGAVVRKDIPDNHKYFGLHYKGL